jgi:hypothetical protein
LHGQQKLPVISRWRNKTKEKGGCIVQNNLNKWPVDFHDFYGGCAAAPVKVEFMIQKINILEGWMRKTTSKNYKAWEHAQLFNSLSEFGFYGRIKQKDNKSKGEF